MITEQEMKMRKSPLLKKMGFTVWRDTEYAFDHFEVWIVPLGANYDLDQEIRFRFQSKVAEADWYAMRMHVTTTSRSMKSTLSIVASLERAITYWKKTNQKSMETPQELMQMLIDVGCEHCARDNRVSENVRVRELLPLELCEWGEDWEVLGRPMRATAVSDNPKDAQQQIWEELGNMSTLEYQEQFEKAGRPVKIVARRPNAQVIRDPFFVASVGYKKDE